MGRQSQYPVKRDEIVTAISTILGESHRNPTMREIATRTNLSVATLHAYLGKLSDEGLIEWRTKRHRSIRLTPEGQRRANTTVPF